MTRTSAAVALLPLCLAAALAFAQQATPPHSREPGLAGPQAQTGEAATSADAASHVDRDARACLDFVTNIGVIRCAEKYRNRSGRSSR